MAGHSKWANIKHRKGAQDSKKAKIFQKISKEISVAIKEGGGDLKTNPRLKLAIEKAKSENIPNENIKKILTKKDQNKDDFFEVNYEGYGPYGIAFFIECWTDNINRISSQVKHCFSKNDGNLGTNGSVSYLFKNIGIIVLDSKLYNFESIMDISIETEVLDVYEEDGFIILETLSENFLKVKNFLESKNIKDFIEANITKVAEETVELEKEQILKIQKLIEDFEEIEDVQEVFCNLK